MRALRLILAVAVLACAPALLTACPDDAPPTDPGCEDCTEVPLQVASSSARACELLLQSDTGDIATLRFAEGVIGRSVTEGSRTGVALTATTDAPLPDKPVTVAAHSDFTVVTSRCFDAAGAPLEGPGITR